MPTHVVARAAPGTLLFRTHEEARRLWEELVRCCPDLLALCLMPDHLHLILPDADLDRRVHDALSAYARWRNARRGEAGAVFAPRPPPQVIPDAEHLSRTIRYVHLNPDRKGLVHDPLGWPWSTHRDAVGLVARLVIPVANSRSANWLLVLVGGQARSAADRPSSLPGARRAADRRPPEIASFLRRVC